MTSPETTTPTNAKAFFELLLQQMNKLNSRLDALDPPDTTANPGADPLFSVLTKILGAVREFQSSQEVMHQRLDAIARYVPGAARAISGK